MPTCGIGLGNGLGIAGGISRGKRLSSSSGIIAADGADGLGSCGGCKLTDTRSDSNGMHAKCQPYMHKKV